MNDTLERVTRAIQGVSTDIGAQTYDDASKEFKQFMKEKAQAAIDELEACGYVKIDDLIEKADSEDNGMGCPDCGQNHSAIAREWLKEQKPALPEREGS